MKFLTSVTIVFESEREIERFVDFVHGLRFADCVINSADCYNLSPDFIVINLYGKPFLFLTIHVIKKGFAYEVQYVTQKVSKTVKVIDVAEFVYNYWKDLATRQHHVSWLLGFATPGHKMNRWAQHPLFDGNVILRCIFQFVWQ